MPTQYVAARTREEAEEAADAAFSSRTMKLFSSLVETPEDVPLWRVITIPCYGGPEAKYNSLSSARRYDTPDNWT